MASVATASWPLPQYSLGAVHVGQEDLQSQNAVWLERQRQAEQDRTMLIAALEKERANLVSRYRVSGVESTSFVGISEGRETADLGAAT